MCEFSLLLTPPSKKIDNVRVAAGEDSLPDEISDLSKFPTFSFSPEIRACIQFFPSQNSDKDIRGHFRGYPYSRRAPPVTTAWFVLRLLVKNSAPDVDGQLSPVADKGFCVEQDMNCVAVLAATTIKIMVFCV
jgi:hypothetical protein